LNDSSTERTKNDDNTEQNKIDIGEIEVVFISLDSVKSEYEQYRSTMPWYSVPHSNLWQLNIKEDLSKKYGVRSIPTLVILKGESGEVVTVNGRSEYGGYFKGEYQVASSGCAIS
jgi:thiol-disulfide isomerase/thioredoxin